MRFVLVLLLSTAVPIATPPPAVAQAGGAQPSAGQLATAREVIERIGMVDLAITGMMSALDVQFAATPEMLAFRGVMEDWARSVFETEDAKESFARIYAAEFTEEELRELLAFYATPLGRKLVEKQPALTRAGAEAGQRLAERHQMDLLLRLQEREAELRRQ